MEKDIRKIIVNSLMKQYGASLSTRRLLQRFLELSDNDYRPIEFSSEASCSRGMACLRPLFPVLKKEEVVRLLPVMEYSALDVKRFMFANDVDPCFGLGVNDYKHRRGASRIKIYNFYDQSKLKVNVKEHVRRLCKEVGVDFRVVANDMILLKHLLFSAVDVYEGKGVALKVYSRLLLTKDLIVKYSNVFDKAAVKQYALLYKVGALPKLFSFCIRYSGRVRSWRTDFLCNTKDVLPHLKLLDLPGAASRLYRKLMLSKMNVRLTYIAMDLDKRPRTQFYFSIY